MFGFAERRAGPPAPDAFRQVPTTELAMRGPELLTDKRRGPLAVACAMQLLLGLLMVAAAAAPVVALILH